MSDASEIPLIPRSEWVRAFEAAGGRARVAFDAYIARQREEIFTAIVGNREVDTVGLLADIALPGQEPDPASWRGRVAAPPAGRHYDPGDGRPGSTVYDEQGNAVGILGLDGKTVFATGTALFGTSDLRGRDAADFRRFVEQYIDVPPFRVENLPMHTNTALMRAIVREPAEDTPRLVYADWLDEQAGESGDHYGKPYAAHAELIRLQIEAARAPDCSLCHKIGRFRGTHRQFCLLTNTDPAGTDINPDRPVDVECPVCDSYARQHRVRFLLDTKYPVHPAAGVKLAKGQEVRVTGKELWSAAELAGAREVRYVRGFVGIASYRTTAFLNFGADAVKACPLEMVVLSDRPLRETPVPFGRIGYFWAPAVRRASKAGAGLDGYADFDYPGCVIPEHVWDLAYALRDKDNAETVHDSYRWVSFALLSIARAEAGLPAWSPRTDRVPPFKSFTPGLPGAWFDKYGRAHGVTPAAWDQSDELFHQFTDRDPALIHYKGFAAYLSEHAFREGGAVGSAMPNEDQIDPALTPEGQGLAGRAAHFL